MKSNHEDFAKIFNNSMFSNNIVSRADLTQGENLRYFQQYRKLYYTAFCIQMQMKQFQKLNTDLKDKIHTVQKNIEICQKTDKHNTEKANRHKPKRFRRTNQMIQRLFRCNYPKCDKAYASQGSLQQHIRLKHEDSPPVYHHHSHHRSSKRQRKQQQQPESVSQYDGSSYSEEESDNEEEEEQQLVVKKQEQS